MTEQSKLIEQIRRDAAAVALLPEKTRARYQAELAAVFHNPGIQFSRALAGEK